MLLFNSLDLDKCADGTHNCDVNAECNNTRGRTTYLNVIDTTENSPDSRKVLLAFEVISPACSAHWRSRESVMLRS